MKLKEQKKFGILWLSIGAALFLAGLLLGETGYSSYISGFGGALMGVGAARLLRVRRLSRDPEKAADYDASLTDERTVYISNKARSMTFSSVSLFRSPRRCWRSWCSIRCSWGRCSAA